MEQHRCRRAEELGRKMAGWPGTRKNRAPLELLRRKLVHENLVRAMQRTAAIGLIALDANLIELNDDVKLFLKREQERGKMA